TDFGYGANNNVTTVRNRLNKTWTFGFGTNNRFSSLTDPDTKLWTLGYALPSGPTGILTPPLARSPTGTTSVGSITAPTNRTDKTHTLAAGVNAAKRTAKEMAGSGTSKSYARKQATHWIYSSDSTLSKTTPTASKITSI